MNIQSWDVPKHGFKIKRSFVQELDKSWDYEIMSMVLKQPALLVSFDIL